MAKPKFSANTIKRTDLYRVDPESIVVREEARGRRFRPTEDDIKRRAVSMFVHTQLQPINGRRMSDGSNRVETVAGFTRVNAGRLLRKGFTYEGKKYHDPDFLIEIRLVKADDLAALLMNITENTERNATSPIDDAFNQDRLRTEHGFTGKQIAEAYNYNNQNKVGRLKKLLQLTEDEQLLVHTGKLSVAAALEILEMSDEQRAAAVEKAMQGMKVSAAELQDTQRDAIMADNEETIANGGTVEETDTKAKPRSVANLRKFLAGIVENEEQEVVVRFAKDMQKYLAGKTSDKAMMNALYRVLDGERYEYEVVEETPAKAA